MRDVDDFNESKCYDPLYVPVSILVDPHSSNFNKHLQYPLTIEGIDVTDETSANISQPKIVIDISLDDYTHSTGHTEDPKCVPLAIGNKLMYVVCYCSKVCLLDCNLAYFRITIMYHLKRNVVVLNLIYFNSEANIKIFGIYILSEQV